MPRVNRAGRKTEVNPEETHVLQINNSIFSSALAWFDTKLTLFYVSSWLAVEDCSVEKPKDMQSLLSGQDKMQIRAFRR